MLVWKTRHRIGFADNAGLGHRRAFSEATCLLIRSLPKAKSWLARKERKIGKKRALGALAARLARTVYHLWRKQEAFDVTKFLAS